MFKIGLLVLLCQLFPVMVWADITFTTSTGAIFTRVKGPGEFGQAWKAPNDTTWSATLGRFSNEPLQSDQNYKVVDSPAVEACKKIGGTLPSLYDYEVLLTFFETHSRYARTEISPPSIWLSGDQWLTLNGKKDWEALFPDTAKDWYWTTTLFEPCSGYDITLCGALQFEEINGFSDIYAYWSRRNDSKSVLEARKRPYNVRCILK